MPISFFSDLAYQCTSPSLSSCMTALLHSRNLSLVDLRKSFCSFIFLISTNSLSYSLAALGRQQQLCHWI